MHLLLVAGARPNLMKIAPLQAALDGRGVRSTLVHTGQHYDRMMNDVFFDELGIRPPDHHLGVGSGSHAVQTARIMESFEPVIESEKPDIVVVVGDVNSTVACALVAAKLHVEVAHVEAGLRSGDWAMPEEVNRLVTDRLSQYLLAPSAGAVSNLRAEGYDESTIALVGNIMVDTLFANRDRAAARPTLAGFDLSPGDRYALLTLHRPSNVDDPERFRGLIGAVEHVAAQVPVIYPVHPRVRSRIDTAALHPNIRLCEPLGYLDFINLEANAALVLTDSGGLQEETTALGVPCLTLRENTERPVTIDEGTNQLAGVEPERIVALADEILASGPRTTEPPRPDLWDGETSGRILDALGV